MGDQLQQDSVPQENLNSQPKLTNFLVRRFFSILLVWLGVTLLTFLVATVVPSDPVALRLGPKASTATIEKMRHEFGLDLPLPQQYFNYLNKVLHGDLGKSIWSGRAVTQDLADYLPGTIELGLTAFFLIVILGIPLGILAASSPSKWIDKAVQIFSTFGLALPLFWFGLVLQLLFYRQWGLLPFDSRIDLQLGNPEKITGLYLLDTLIKGDGIRFANSLKHLILPAITLSLPGIGAVARMTRASLLEVLGQDYIRGARAKGLSERGVVWHHAVRNALLPVVTLLGNTFNGLLAGVFVVEAIFNWPGIGWYATKVILASDYGAIISVTLVIAIISTIVNLFVDICYGSLDPRIKLA